MKLKTRKKIPAVVSHAKDLIYFRACVYIYTHIPQGMKAGCLHRRKSGTFLLLYDSSNISVINWNGNKTNQKKNNSKLNRNEALCNIWEWICLLKPFSRGVKHLQDFIRKWKIHIEKMGPTGSWKVLSLLARGFFAALLNALKEGKIGNSLLDKQ